MAVLAEDVEVGRVAFDDSEPDSLGSDTLFISGDRLHDLPADLGQYITAVGAGLQEHIHGRPPVRVV